MPAFGLRPRFELRVTLSPEETFDRLETLLEDDDTRCVGDLHSDHADIGIPEADQHYWSPFLKIVVRPDGEATRLEGRFGPNPNVWTLFLAIYAFCAFTVFGALIIGFSQWSIGQSANGFVVAGIATIVAIAAYGVALIGQGLAREQMNDLRRMIDETFEDARRTPDSTG